MSNTKKSSAKSLAIAAKIKRARKEAGLSQKQLGSSTGLSDKAISSYEVGRATPTVETLREISRVTYKPVTFFLEDNDPDELNVQMKIQVIERELQEIKKILQKKKMK